MPDKGSVKLGPMLFTAARSAQTTTSTHWFDKDRPHNRIAPRRAHVERAPGRTDVKANGEALAQLQTTGSTATGPAAMHPSTPTLHRT